MINYIKNFLKIKIFFKTEILILSMTVLISTVAFNYMYNDLLNDTTDYRIGVSETQKKIIDIEKKTVNFISEEQGSVINDDISYEKYEERILKYKEIFECDPVLDSLFDIKLNMKYRYMNVKMKIPPKSNISINFDRRFMIGNPKNHYTVDMTEYLDKFHNNIDNLNTTQNNIIKRNTRINKEILIILYKQSSILEKKENDKKIILEKKIDKSIFRLRIILISHITVIFVLLFLISIDFRKISRRNINNKNFINTIINKVTSDSDDK